MQEKDKPFVPSIELVTETMAEIYTAQGLYKEALEIYKRILAQNPENKVIRHKLEEVYHLMGMQKESGGTGREQAIKKLEDFLKRIRERKEAYEKGIGNTWS
ncbi:MAG: tetratricopeptide repeat protein [Nitrospirota bacterium]